VTKTTMTAIVAATMALSAPLAHAQNAVPQSAAPRAAVSMTEMKADQLRASKFIGSSVYDVHNRNIGDIKDLIMTRDGRIAGVVLDVGAFLGMGGKYVALALADIKTDNNRLTLDTTKEQLQAAQVFEFRDTNLGSGSSTPPSTLTTRPAPAPRTAPRD